MKEYTRIIRIFKLILFINMVLLNSIAYHAAVSACTQSSNFFLEVLKIVIFCIGVQVDENRLLSKNLLSVGDKRISEAVISANIDSAARCTSVRRYSLPFAL